MVSELLDQADDLVASSRPDIQVTGKVAVTASSSPSANTTSVIRRSPHRAQSASPDSPDSNGSGHEDSTWFLRQVLQRGSADEESAERVDADTSPLTPATSPARGLRRPRPSESADEDNEAEDDDASSVHLKSESQSEDVESKRARVETIVSTMRTCTSHSASSSNQRSETAGCKKRKLYQPQQHDSAKFTSEGEEEEDDDERNDDSIVSEAEQESRHMSRSADSALPHQVANDPLRSLQDRIASLHQQQQRYAAHLAHSPVSHESKHSNHEMRRPVRDDSGRSRHSLHLNSANRGANLPTDLSHLTQAHAAYIDATRRLLMEQQQQQQQQQRQQQRSSQQSNKSQPPQDPAATELEGLAEMLKSELASSLAQLIDNTLSRFAQQQQRRNVIVSNTPTKFGVNSDTSVDLDSNKLQRGRVIDRGLRNGDLAALGLTPFLRTPYAAALPHLLAAHHQSANPLSQIANSLGSINSIALANIGSYGQQQPPTQQAQQSQPSQSSVEQPQPSPRYSGRDSAANEDASEQNEALSLVVSPKKRRTVKTDRDSPVPSADTRLSPLEISLAAHSCGPNSPPPSRSPTPPVSSQRFTTPQPPRSASHPPQQAGHPAHPQLLHHPSLFSNYSAYFAAAAAGAAAAAAASRTKSPECERSPPSASLLHPALLASHSSTAHLHHHRHHHHSHSDSLNDRHSDSSDGASPYDGIHQSSTLTPMHLRKAKLMFFWVRYPSSSVLKTFFPDVKFNKNNTAQLVKWFSNFR